ncbi:J domain-containing protein [Anaeromicropila herbilytica]|uniref:J domain-containing protein n=1 Tax=Anaeromicropila herbilytica TaxID=2785025 RepID=A0A7R7EL32_9FIRM|nr:J domain-containing protein [Anaeromicropila herbilytica]BCN30762.1 hypothetical protein bsdtb5_20570 [Anaeromicropila herbilytica]
MSQSYEKMNDIKRKLRELKKLEIKVRFPNYDIQKNNKKKANDYKNIELVWDKFFSLKDIGTKNVKYSINQLSSMNKDEFKNVINEYFYHVYYCCYKGGITDHSFIDEAILSQLGLTINADSSEIKRQFKELVKIYHPDNGGDPDKFAELIERYKDLRK